MAICSFNDAPSPSGSSIDLQVVVTWAPSTQRGAVVR